MAMVALVTVAMAVVVLETITIAPIIGSIILYYFVMKVERYNHWPIMQGNTCNSFTNNSYLVMFNVSHQIAIIHYSVTKIMNK